MKIRNGFISNSSSSSFVIMSKEKLTKEKLIELFGVPKKSMIYDLCKDIASCLLNSTNKECSSYDEFVAYMCDDYGCDTIEDIGYDNELSYAKKHGFKYFYIGSVASDGDAIESALCDLSINYKDENILISKAGGY